MQKKHTFRVTTAKTLASDAVPAHHFFASSLGSWRVSYDLETLIRGMKHENMPFVVWLVPGPVEAEYRIENFAPQVEGIVRLACYF